MSRADPAGTPFFPTPWCGEAGKVQERGRGPSNETCRGRRHERIFVRLSRISLEGILGTGARDPRRRQATLGGRSGGPETAGIERGSSRTSQAPAVAGSTGARDANRAARSRSMGADGASLGASGSTGARPQEGPLQGRRRAGTPAGSAAAAPLSPPANSAACAGMSWPTSQSPQLASADSSDPSAITAERTSNAAAPQERRNRGDECWNTARMADSTLSGGEWVVGTPRPRFFPPGG